MAIMSVSGDEACQKPPPLTPVAKKSSQAESQSEANQIAGDGEGSLRNQQAKAVEAKVFGEQVQNERLQANRDLINRWDQELSAGNSQYFPGDRAKWRNDQRLAREAELARTKRRKFPAEKADKATVPAIRANLNQFSRAQELEGRSTKKIAMLAAAIAKLLKMKSAGEKNAAALSTENPHTINPVISSPLSPTPVNRVQENSPAHVDNKMAEQISESQPQVEQSHPGSDADSEGKSLVHRSSLKAQLREMLRKKMAGAGLDEIPENFLGELGLSTMAGLSDLPPGEGEDFLERIQEEIFQLAGTETDSEIRRLRAELEEELNQSEGVLPSESPNLFARVKAVHDACVVKKCVFRSENLVASNRRQSAPE